MYAESLDGEEAEYYCEVKNGIIVRQIYCFSGNIFWADEQSEANEDYPIGDNPEFDENFVTCDKITGEIIGVR